MPDTPLKYEAAISQFLELMEWTDKPNFDYEKKSISLNVGLTIAEMTGRGIIEVNDESDIFDYFIYYDVRGKKKRSTDLSLLMNELNRRWSFGRFETVDAEETIRVRWRHRIDFEGSNPTGLTIQRNFQPGWNATERFASVFAAVALTNQTANVAIEEYDREQEEHERAEAAQLSTDEVPTEL